MNHVSIKLHRWRTAETWAVLESTPNVSWYALQFRLA
jgi:hypothetical protein